MNIVNQVILKESLRVKDKFKNLSKKNGDDKLVVSLVLIVIGCVLCFFYRDKVLVLLTSALTTLGDKLQALFNGI